MALEAICGLTDASYMQTTRFGLKDFENDIQKASGNFENPFCLDVPPYENVRFQLNETRFSNYYNLYIQLFLAL